MASINRNTEGLTDQSSLSTNLLRRSALALIKRPWDPLRFQNDAINKTEIKNVHSQSLEINFGASDSNNFGGALIVSKDFNSLVFQLSNVGKQQEINSFQSAERRTLADILADIISTCH